jgi:hypothetical protein
MKKEFLLWANKKKLLEENNQEVNDHMVQWLWIAWQTAWNASTISHKATIDKLRMERDAYSVEIEKVLYEKHCFEALSQPEEKL